MATVFICYRRSDSAPYAGRLHDRLCERFGVAQIFMDITTIEPGENFDEVIRGVIGRCDIFLPLIGPRRLGVLDPAQHRRLYDPDDPVRIEVQAALERKIRVIPALVGGATMPAKADLPSALSSLPKLNAAAITEPIVQRSNDTYNIGRWAFALPTLYSTP